ncbi:hypothetical protein [uncultured Paenibacillus sp.]|nr:hypothetical protein [uncultured Paenibacillus sp.]
MPTIVIGETVLRGVWTRETLERAIEEELAKQSQRQDTGEGMVCGPDGCD